MDYAIYKTTDGRQPHIVHTFTQAECNHRALAAARAKLDDMWRRILQKPEMCRNANGNKNEFQYDHMTSVRTKERIRFYIAPLRHRALPKQ